MLKKILVALVGVVVVGITAVFVLVPDEAALKSLIVERLSAHTGRKVTVGRVSFSLAGQSKLIAEDVAITSPAWAREATLLSAKRVEVVVDLLPLLQQRLHMRHASADDIVLNLERGEGDVHSWTFAAKEANSNRSSSRLDRLSVNNVAVNYFAGGNHWQTKLTQLDLNQVAGAPQQQTLTASGTSTQTSFSVTGTLDGLTRFTEQQGPLGVTLTATVEALNLELNGTLSQSAQNVTVVASGTLPKAFHASSPAVKASASLNIEWPMLHAQSLRFDLLGHRGGGDVRLNLSGSRPHLAGVLSFSELNLQSSEESDRSGRLFSAQPVALEGLNRLDADLTVSASKVIANTPMTNLTTKLALAGGQLSVRRLSAQILGGSIAGEAHITAQAANSTVAVDLKLKGLAASKISTLATGAVDGNIALTARGSSPAEWAASANGQIRAGLGKGRIRARTADTLTGGVMAIFDAITKSSDWVALNCAVAAFDVSQGKATSSALVADMSNATLVGEGHVNLVKERLALLVKPHPKGVTLNIAVPVRITGSIRNPDYALDEAAAARRVGGVLAGIVFPPALIAAFADIGYESSGCLPGRAAQSTAQATAKGGKIVDDASATASRAATAAASGAGKLLDEAKEVTSKAAKSAGNAAVKAGNAVGSAVDSTLKEVGKGIKSLFGN